jgi:hypothetical protein
MKEFPSSEERGVAKRKLRNSQQRFAFSGRTAFGAGYKVISIRAQNE